MEQLIKQLLLKLQIEYIVLLACPFLVLAAGQLDWIPAGLYATQDTHGEAFMLQVSAVLATLIFVPLSLKLFTLNTKKNLLRYTLDGAVRSYHVWSCVRLAILEVAVCFDLVSYYLTQNNIGILLACIVYIVMISCCPSAERIEKYLDDSKENRD